MACALEKFIVFVGSLIEARVPFVRRSMVPNVRDRRIDLYAGSVVAVKGRDECLCELQEAMNWETSFIYENCELHKINFRYLEMATNYFNPFFA